MRVHGPKLFGDWRDFGREYAIIVLGVLTALVAQSVAEDLSWRQKIGAAIADMDNELSRGDGPQAYARVSMHDCIASRLSTLRATIEIGDRKKSRKLIEQFWLPKRTYDSLAREAATASDVSSHMPHERMLQYRIAYEVVPDMQRLADKELADLGHLRALPSSGGMIETPEKLSMIDAIEALQLDNDAIARESRFTLIRLGMMNLRLDRFFVERDIGEARVHYSGCLTSPNLPSSILGATD